MKRLALSNRFTAAMTRLVAGAANVMPALVRHSSGLRLPAALGRDHF